MGSAEGQLDILLVARHRFGGFPPLGDWQMARALSARHRVLYVEPPTVGRRLPAEIIRAMRAPRIRKINERLFVMRPIGVPGATRKELIRFGDLVIERQIATASRRTLAAHPVLASFDPLRGNLRRVPRSLLVYWRRDRFDAYEAPTGALLAARERSLLAEAQLVACVAPALVDEARRRSPGRVVSIPNGCDAEHFRRPRERPEGLPRADVVIGFVGGSHWRLDRSLITAIAEARPEWKLVLVGGPDGSSSPRHNVEFVPYVPYEDVPAWMQHLDVGLVPYAPTTFNLGSFPLKAFEYLAAGVPVVSTPIPALNGWSPWIRIGEDVDEMVASIESALKDGPDAASCRKVAAGNTWGQRADELVEAIRTELAV